MNSFHNLPPQEQRNIQQAIATLLSGGAESTDHRLPVPRPIATIRQHLGGYVHSAHHYVTEQAVEHAAARLVRRLAGRGIILYGPGWLGGREYYRWLTEVFLELPLDRGVSRQSPQTYRYTELVPDSVDNIFCTIDAFVRQLFGRVNTGTADAVSPRVTDLTYRKRYLTAWTDSFRRVRLNGLRPLAVHDLADGEARLEFQIGYSVVFEDGSSAEFTGKGDARLLLRYTKWWIADVVFPGFTLPPLPNRPRSTTYAAPAAPPVRSA